MLKDCLKRQQVEEWASPEGPFGDFCKAQGERFLEPSLREDNLQYQRKQARQVAGA
jgi:hypothetical protein